MQHNHAEIILDINLESTKLDDCKREARKIAEGIADASEAIIASVHVVHYPSGSGEPEWFDANK